MAEPENLLSFKLGHTQFFHGHTQFLSLTVPENAGAYPLSKTWLRPWIPVAGNQPVYYIPQCLKVILNSRKMRPLQFYGLEVCNFCIKLRERNILNLHDGLLSYQPTSTANSAHQGWIGCAVWLVAREAIVQIQNSMPFLVSFTILKA